MSNSDILLSLRQMIAELLAVNIENVDPDRDLFILGLDSLVAIRLLHKIEVSMGVRLIIADVFDMPTAKQLEQAIQHHLAKVHD